jgi:hypothetical protein
MGQNFPGEKGDPMRIQSITAFLTTESEVGEAFRLVGLRARTFAEERGGKPWLIGQTLDGKRELVVNLEPTPATWEKAAILMADFGPHGSKTFATSVLDALLRAHYDYQGGAVQLGEMVDWDYHPDNLPRFVEVARSMKHCVLDNCRRPKFEITMAA